MKKHSIIRSLLALENVVMKGKFVLDANVLIEVVRRYYAFDIAPPSVPGSTCMDGRI
jgi:hypothetical protein